MYLLLLNEILVLEFCTMTQWRNGMKRGINNENTEKGITLIFQAYKHQQHIFILFDSMAVLILQYRTLQILFV